MDTYHSIMAAGLLASVIYGIGAVFGPLILDWLRRKAGLYDDES